jgi:hypothetical protein
MPDRRGRSFAPLPPGIVKVRLRGESGAALARRITSLPDVKVVTGPDAYSGDRLYLTVEITEADEAAGQ